MAGTVASPAVIRAQDSNEKLRIGFIGPGGRGFGAHVKTLARLHKEGRPVELVAAADVYSEHRERTAKHDKKENGNDVETFVDYRGGAGSQTIELETHEGKIRVRFLG